MHYYEIAISKIFRAGIDFLTYSSNVKLSIGHVVMVEVGKKQIVGVIFKKVPKPTYPTKEVCKLIEQNPIPKPMINLIGWISDYYITPIATVLQTVLPSGLNKKRQIKENVYKIVKRKRTNILFNKEQSNAIEKISDFNDGTFLLQGITGSGKTEVYIELAKRTLNANRSVIILIPEIALTSQMISEFSNHFDDLIITHSKMTEAARHHAWQQALNSDTPRVVIGPRSALFMPLKDIGLIVVDEAHEPSYKQDQSPKYSALRAASTLANFSGAKVVLGSATPSVSDRFLAEKSNRPIIRLEKAARIGSTAPTIDLIDMSKRDSFKKHRFLSDNLLNRIELNLESGHQTLIFHNRRGSTHTTICYKCGWKADCPKCYLPLSLHSDNHNLRCHICDHKTHIPTFCPECNSAEIIHKGIGTKLIESEIAKLFPAANIARFDADNKTNATVNARYEDLYDGKIDIAIGTQTIAKGLDLPNLRTVGIIQADAGLSLPDFFTNERIFQLLTQVIGRVGRNEHKTNVIIQSYQPNHPSIQYSLTQDYESFYKNALIERRAGLFPPFVYILKLTCAYKTEAIAIKNAKQLALELKNKNIGKNIQILGPTPAFYERQNETYRWQLVLKCMNRRPLADIVSNMPIGKNWQADLDPTSLL
jgi:primosomal protein N' (replication factor Y)